MSSIFLGKEASELGFLFFSPVEELIHADREGGFGVFLPEVIDFDLILFERTESVVQF